MKNVIWSQLEEHMEVCIIFIFLIKTKYPEKKEENMKVQSGMITLIRI